METIREVADEVSDYDGGELDVIGYTDDLGSAQHGRKLSKQRAKAVAKVLREELDTPKFEINVEGKGEADPAVPNDSEKNRKRNRRVELTLDLD